MKTPLLVLFLLAPLHLVAQSGEKSDCASTSPTTPAKSTAAPLALKSTAKPATFAPGTPSHAGKPRHTPAQRPPAYLFM